MKNLIRKGMLSLVILFGCFAFIAVIPGGKALADPQPLQQAEDNSSSSSSGGNSKTVCDSTNLTSDQKKSCQSCDNTTTNPALNNCLQNNVIVTQIQTIVNFLSAVVGVVVVGTIILGGIQYSTAGGSPEAVTKAKQRMTNGAIAFGAFLFIFAFLQWLIPGGIFG